MRPAWFPGAGWGLRLPAPHPLWGLGESQAVADPSAAQRLEDWGPRPETLSVAWVSRKLASREPGELASGGPECPSAGLSSVAELLPAASGPSCAGGLCLVGSRGRGCGSGASRGPARVAHLGRRPFRRPALHAAAQQARRVLGASRVLAPSGSSCGFPRMEPQGLESPRTWHWAQAVQAEVLGHSELDGPAESQAVQKLPHSRHPQTLFQGQQPAFPVLAGSQVPPIFARWDLEEVGPGPEAGVSPGS